MRALIVVDMQRDFIEPGAPGTSYFLLESKANLWEKIGLGELCNGPDDENPTFCDTVSALKRAL